jgi:signal peptidase I
MMDKRAREPLAAVLMSLVIPGWGQMYAGRSLRGIIFLLAVVVPPSGLAAYLLQPAVKINQYMLFPFALCLVIFLYQLADAWLCVKRYNAANGLAPKASLVKAILLVAAILFVCVQYARVPGFVKKSLLRSYTALPDTMAPTVYDGEKVLVDLTAYKARQPQRGDIALMILSEDQNKEHLLRIVGLPGETVEIRDQALLINGEPVRDSWSLRRRYYNQSKLSKKKTVTTVPADSYFVLGDYSATSQDSRHLGCVPRANLIGKAFKRIYPFNRSGSIE